MQSVIVIPARYGSTRLPGKPLLLIAGVSLLARVFRIAQLAVQTLPSTDIVVATDDERIAAHCKAINAPYIMTSPECPTGADRAFAAIQQLKYAPDFIVNLQGDAALTPPWFVRQVLEAGQKKPTQSVITPFVRLTWGELDQLRQQKQQTPYSGTCVTLQPDSQQALWFSKQIIPTIRQEADWRQQSPLSPVCRHIGLYGYRYAALQAFCQLPPSTYERWEGLEQLRFLENQIPIQMTEVDYQGRQGMSGIDSHLDIQRAEAIVARDGEF